MLGVLVFPLAWAGEKFLATELHVCYYTRWSYDLLTIPMIIEVLEAWKKIYRGSTSDNRWEEALDANYISFYRTAQAQRLAACRFGRS